MRVVYHRHAREELIEAAQFYGKRDPVLGAEFLETADEAVQAIAEAPARWPELESRVRRFLMRRFPYAIYYRMIDDGIQIVAFKHGSRRPGYWHYRLSD